MADNRIEYVFKVDKAGRNYALRVTLKTGKSKRVPYKDAKKRSRDMEYRRGKAAVKAKAATVKAKTVSRLADTGSGATYSEYERMLPIVMEEIVQRRKDKGLSELSPANVRAKAKQETIDYRTGVATRMRFAWVYRVVIERYLDDETGEIIVECDTSIFRARGLKRDGDEFDKMCGVCQDAYDQINNLDLCSLDGGACVVMYNKSDKSIIEEFELGKGCGFSFDFKNYTNDEDEIGDDGFNSM